MCIQSEISVSRLCVGKEQKRNIYPSSRKVEKESQRETEETDFPKSRQEFRLHILQIKRVYEGMAELLRNSRYQHTYDQVERMVKAENTDVYLETMEITENKGKEPDETRNA